MAVAGGGRDLTRDDASDSRLKGMSIGFVVGGALGFLVSERGRFLGPSQGTHVLAGAVFGALAGLIISGPSPGESSELRGESSVRAYLPTHGGFGLAFGL